MAGGGLKAEWNSYVEYYSVPQFDQCGTLEISIRSRTIAMPLHFTLAEFAARKEKLQAEL
jgi:hypothetical protein